MRGIGVQGKGAAAPLPLLSLCRKDLRFVCAYFFD